MVLTDRAASGQGVDGFSCLIDRASLKGPRVLQRQRVPQRQRVLQVTAYGSAALALLSAGVSAYWTAGGTALLSTVGGDVEALARRGGTSALVLGAGTTTAKLAAVALSLSLVWHLGRRLAPRVLACAALVGGALLTVYGSVQIVVGGLALLGVTGARPEEPTALRWHVLVWDPWFLLWGLLLGTAAMLCLGSSRRTGSRFRRQPPDRVDSP
jgi:hypothetical protein